MTDFAVANYREFAIETANVDEVLAWAGRWFVQGNAVAWITTDHIPEGLNLRLPEGMRQPYSCPPNLLTATPVWFAGPAGVVLVDSVVKRSTSAVMFAEVLSRALFRTLRIEQGVSYNASALYEPLDATCARILVVADGAPTAAAELVGILSTALAALRDGDFSPADVAGAREQGREVARQATDSPESLLQTAAFSFLLGGEPWGPDELTDAREAVTEADLATVAREFWDNAVWQTPAQVPSAAGVVPLSARTEPVLAGFSYFSEDMTQRFVFAGQGVSVTVGDVTNTVLFSDCVLAMQWGDGGRALLGRDGTAVVIEPARMRHINQQELARVDDAVPPAAVVRLPARPNAPIVQLPTRPPRPGVGNWAALPAALFLLAATYASVIAWNHGSAIGQLNEQGEPITMNSVLTDWAFVAVMLGGVYASIWARLRRHMGSQPTTVRRPNRESVPRTTARSSRTRW